MNRVKLKKLHKTVYLLLPIPLLLLSNQSISLFMKPRAIPFYLVSLLTFYLCRILKVTRNRFTLSLIQEKTSASIMGCTREAFD